MVSNNVFFSFVVAFRDRELERVDFFLSSLKLQEYKNFELIFVDQGSSIEYRSSIEKLCNSYDFAHYLYNDTLGQLWNKSNALNIGIKHANGGYIIISDIDVIFPIHFISQVLSILDSKYFYTFNAFYLPHNLRVQDYLNDISNSSLVLGENLFIGVCIAPKEKLLEIKGYDEYFQVWGGEDDDIIIRLEQSGIIRHHFSATDIKLYHIWHKTRSPQKPTLWYLSMINHLHLNDRHLNNEKSWGELITSDMRFDFQSKEYPRQIAKLVNHQNRVFNDFFEKFASIPSDSVLELTWDNSLILKKRKRLVWVNQKLSKIKYNQYLISHLDETKKQIPTREEFEEFISYFVGINRPLIKDYFISDKGSSIKMEVLKK
jgi:glycosyltransferase involved in cell wall biosynthesis